jgi:predicted nucleic acid-binding protein
VRLLVDINVLLDAVLAREPWVDDAGEILAAAVEERATAYVAGHTITTIHYLVAKVQGRATATAAVSDLLRVVDVVPVEKADLHQAFALGLADFEDAVQATCALKIGADFIVTRNHRDFAGVAVPAKSPAFVLSRL